MYSHFMPKSKVVVSLFPVKASTYLAEKGFSVVVQL